MTYEQLGRKIASMNTYQRNCHVTYGEIFVLIDLYENSGKTDVLENSEETDVLDDGHPYLTRDGVIIT